MGQGLERSLLTSAVLRFSDVSLIGPLIRLSDQCFILTLFNDALFNDAFA